MEGISYEIEVRFDIRLNQSLMIIFKALKAKNFSIAFRFIITHMLLGYMSLGPVYLSDENEIKKYLASFSKIDAIKSITFIDIFETNNRITYTPKQA